MKKTMLSALALLLTVAMLLTLCACGNTSKRKNADDDEDEEEEETTVTTTADEEETETDVEPVPPVTAPTTKPTAAAPEKSDVDLTSIEGEWQGDIVVDDWLAALIGEPTGETSEEVQLLTTLYGVMIDDIRISYYMEFYEDGTADWKMKDTFVTDMLMTVRTNLATYFENGGVYDLMAIYGLSQEDTDMYLASQGMTYDDLSKTYLTAMETGMQSSLQNTDVMAGVPTKDGFYIGLGQYTHSGDTLTFTGNDGTSMSFAVNLTEGTLTAKAFYFGGVPVSLTLERVL